MPSRKELLAIWASASFVCRQCGQKVTRADKPGVIYGAFLKLKFCSHACSHLGSRQDPVVRFWEQVEKTEGCWLWTGTLNDKGYGNLHAGGGRIYAHRFSYELHKGPLGDFHALHSCDNPRCVNPAHLRPGTHQDNMRDRDERGRKRNVRGGEHPSAKLTEAQAKEVLISSEGSRALAKRFGVGRTTIQAIRQGRNWRCLRDAAA